MKIGLLFCAFQCEDYIDEVLAPWIDLKKDYDINIVAVSSLFKEYEGMVFDKDNSATTGKLTTYLKNGALSNIHISPVPVSEADARNKALDSLKDLGCDLIWLLDGDEFYSVDCIKKIVKFVESKPLVSWFGINFKNYVFDGTVWIDGFCPPRIFRSKSGIYNIDCFYWDNDILYKINNNAEYKRYNEMSSISIPKNIAHIKHMTWLSNEKSKRKVEYQIKHFGGNCSYRWNDKENKLEFNLDYYAKLGISVPILKVD